MKYLSIPEKLMVTVFALAIISTIGFAMTLTHISASFTYTVTFGKQPPRLESDLDKRARILAVAIDESQLRPTR